MDQNLIKSAVENLWSRGIEERKESIKYLKTIESNKVFSVLRELLTSSELETQTRAAEAILILDNTRIDEVLFLLDVPESWARYHLCGFLLDYGFEHKKTIEKLIDLVSNDPDAGVRGIACEALGWIGDASVIEPLTEIAINDEEENIHLIPVRDFAVRAIATLASRFAGVVEKKNNFAL